jgi:hypothetical protein
MTSVVAGNQLYALGDKPFNKSWEDWSADWWKWLLSTPDNINPVNDATGELQNVAQLQANVFFLAGTHQKKAERACTIPAARAIFFPIATMSASYVEFPNVQTEAELWQYAEEGNQVSDMSLAIDGMVLDKKYLEQYRVKTPIFDVILPDHNIQLYAKGGPTKVVSDGYWAFLKPLPVGDHTLIINQSTEDHPPSLTLNCGYELTYHLNVK